MQCNLKEIVSFTVPANTRSSNVMEKIGLKRDINGDFEHHEIDTGHRLSRHILYRLSVEDFKV
jgi:RimJ/RimL family protein N-acetyltransferase